MQIYYMNLLSLNNFSIFIIWINGFNIVIIIPAIMDMFKDGLKVKLVIPNMI